MSNIPVKKNGNNDWVEYRKLVLYELSELQACVKEIREEQIKIRLDVKEIKTRASMFGAIAGFIVSTIVSALVAFLF